MVKDVQGMARLGVLAVGLGIGAAWAHTPVASADSSSDWSSTIDSLLSGASPAPATPLDLDISFDGYSLVHDGNAIAGTDPGGYSLAIAYGDGAQAFADGTGGSAYADGTNAFAEITTGTGDFAEADGTNAAALAGGAYTNDPGGNYDTAIDIGNIAPGSGLSGAYAGNGDLADNSANSGTGSYDTAIDIGNNSGGYDGAFAGAGGLTGGNGGDGNHDTAIDVGNNSGDSNGSYSLVGNDNYAYVDGPADSSAVAESGNSNIAYVLDPFGAAGSPDSAYAGDGFSNDLAEVLLAHGNATADTANLLYDIISLFGNFSGSL